MRSSQVARAGRGAGLLPVKISFGADKVLRTPDRARGAGTRFRRTRSTMEWRRSSGEAEPFLDGCRQGQVWGTMWHGAWENDGFRRAWLAEIAAAVGSRGVLIPRRPGIASRRETMINTLADAVEQHADLGLLLAGTRVAGRL